MTRFAFVDQEKALYAVATLCRLLKVSASGYYAWVARAPSKRDVADGVLTAQIEDTFDSNRKGLRVPADPCGARRGRGPRRPQAGRPADAAGRDRGMSSP